MGENIEAHLEKGASVNTIREYLKKVYGSLKFSKFVNTLSDDEIIMVAKKA